MPDPASAAARSYRLAPPPPDATPWREASFAVIDLETTGLDPGADEIIAFATVTVAEGRVRVADAVYREVRPAVMPSRETIRIHGLRESDLAKAPPLAAVIGELLEAIAGRALVAHVAAVERGFLGAALAAHGLELRSPIIDTAALAAELRSRRGRRAQGPDPGGLSSLARSLGLPVHRPHHADGDALTTAQAFVALASHLDAFEPQTVGSLRRLRPQGPRPSLPRRAIARLASMRRGAPG